MEGCTASALRANNLKFFFVLERYRLHNSGIEETKFALQPAIELSYSTVDLTVTLCGLVIAHGSRSIDHEENILSLFVLLVEIRKKEWTILHPLIRWCEGVITDFFLNKIVEDRSPI